MTAFRSERVCADETFRCYGYTIDAGLSEEEGEPSGARRCLSHRQRCELRKSVWSSPSYLRAQGAQVKSLEQGCAERHSAKSVAIRVETQPQRGMLMIAGPSGADVLFRLALRVSAPEGARDPMKVGVEQYLDVEVRKARSITVAMIAVPKRGPPSDAMSCLAPCPNDRSSRGPRPWRCSSSQSLQRGRLFPVSVPYSTACPMHRWFAAQRGATRGGHC